MTIKQIQLAGSRTNPDNPELWLPALERGKKQIGEWKRRYKKMSEEEFINDILYNSNQNVTKKNFPAFVKAIGLNPKLFKA
jgi:hypothetical protein